VPYPYGTCDVVFGPVSPGLAYSVTGLVLVQDRVLTAGADEVSPLYRAVVIAHEVAHAWFGGLVTFSGADRWLDEAVTTYVSRAAISAIIPGAAPWAGPPVTDLPDEPYAPGAAAIRTLEDVIGPGAVLAGLGAMLRQHAHGDASRADLVRCWSAAGGRDLSDWAAQTLIS
jgi:aminopeptidase N